MPGTAAGTLPADAPLADAAPAAPDGKPCPFWRKKKCEAERAALAAAAASVTGDGAVTGVRPVSADTSAIQTAPLDGSVAASPAAAGVLRRPYVQIGIFSRQDNAQRAADQMNAAGLSAVVKPDSSQGKAFWRVIVGPASSIGERDSLAARVRGMGYPDAYPVAG
ncbi:MAG: SPOR domain-containing protein [Rhodobacteraceae bacterium]|nr:SPOR domain-containing protein [Paracoccaceae bacterium]